MEKERLSLDVISISYGKGKELKIFRRPPQKKKETQVPPYRLGAPMPEATPTPMADDRVKTGCQHWLPVAAVTVWPGLS